MSARKRWPDHAPEKDGDPIVAQAILSWMQSQGSPEDSAPSQGPESDAPERSESAPDGAEEHDDTFVTLLCAIQETDIAKRLRGEALPGNGKPRTPAAAEPANADAITPTLEPPVEKPPPPVSTQPTLPTAAPPPEQSAPEDTPENKEILATLRRAIESTESAASLKGAAPPGEAQPDAGEAPPDAPRTAEPAKAVADHKATLESPVASPLPAASTQPEFSEPEPPPIAPPSPPAPDEPPEASEPLPIVVAPEPPEPADTAEEAPAVTPRRQPRSVNGGLLKAPLLIMLSVEIGRLCAKIGMTTDYLDRIELQLEKWFQIWFAPDPRHTPRVVDPPLVAYHWIVDTPQALKIANISSGGLHLLTSERWPHGNIISMTLQRTDLPKEAPDSWIAVDFVVVRWCKDGLAGAFLPSWPGLSYVDVGRAENCADKKMLEHFVKQLAPPEQNQSGSPSGVN